MRVFLDDEREPYMVYEDEASRRGWAIARTVEVAMDLLRTGAVTEISLDHDLGAGNKTGYDLCKWMTQERTWPAVVRIHSANPVGAENMEREYAFYMRYRGGQNG